MDGVSVRIGSLSLGISQQPGFGGITPIHLMAAALAASSARHVRARADRFGMQLDRVEVDVTHEVFEHDDLFTRLLILEGRANAEEREDLIIAARNCPVSRMLEQGSLLISLYGGWIGSNAR